MEEPELHPKLCTVTVFGVRPVTVAWCSIYWGAYADPLGLPQVKFIHPLKPNTNILLCLRFLMYKMGIVIHISLGDSKDHMRS